MSSSELRWHEQFNSGDFAKLFAAEDSKRSKSQRPHKSFPAEPFHFLERSQILSPK